MAPHSSTLAWKIPWTEESGRLPSLWSLRVGHDWVIHFHFLLSCIGEGNSNPLQCSCLENRRDRGAWLAPVYEVAQSWTRLKRLSKGKATSVQNESYGPWWNGILDPSRDCYWMVVGVGGGGWIQFTNLDSYSGWEVQPKTCTDRDWEAGDSLKGVLEVLTVYARTVCGAWGGFRAAKGTIFMEFWSALIIPMIAFLVPRTQVFYFHQ